jgi:hypothetical protein
MTTLAAPVVARPGTSFYVPGVRVMRLSPEMRKDGERDDGPDLDKDILGDLLRVQVTRVSSGPSQYKLTLNNWYLSTALDRAHQTDEFTRLLAFETIAGGNPAWPRFKYNDFVALRFGDRLRIDMRYMPEPGADPEHRTATNAGGWVPMVSGPFTDMKFTFGASDGARVEISGEDDLSMLQDKSGVRRKYEGRGEVKMVEAALARAEYPLRRVAKPLVEHPAFVAENSENVRDAQEKGQSVYDFIMKLAERLDFEVFLEYADLDDPASPVEFHFEPCRASTLDAVFQIERQRDMLEFSPTIKLVDQYTEAKVEGRHSDPNVPAPIRGRARPEDVADELHDRGAVPAGAVRRFFFPNRPNCGLIPNDSNLDPVRAKKKAQVLLRRKAREFFTIDVTTLGQPRLRPGQHVEVTGMRPPFNGFYYVRQVVTTYASDGLRTKIAACRPGMELPPYDEPRT